MRRRTLLRLATSAAGAAVLSPFLTTLGAAGGRPTPRFVFFVEGNGFEPVNVLSSTARAAIDTTLSAPIGDARYWPLRYRHERALELADETLTSATALADLGDLAAKTTVVLGLSSRITGGGHSAWHGVLSSRRTAGGRPAGPTIDTHLAATPEAARMPFDVLRVGYCSHQHHRNKMLNYGTCAVAADVAAPLVLQPGAAFDMLFGATSAPDQYARRGRILDFARADVARALRELPSSSTERVKLERYLEAIATGVAQREAVSAAVAALPSLPSRPGARYVEDLYEVLRAQATNVSIALQGGLTHVAVVGIGTGADFDTFYDTSHRARHATHHESRGSDTARDYIQTQARLQMNVMFELARELDAVPEGDGTLLDHTVLVWIGDNGETHHASADEFPVVLVGGSALGLRGGNRTIVYPGQDRMGAGHRQVSNLWNTFGYLAGEELDAFGGERDSISRSARGPLSELMG